MVEYKKFFKENFTNVLIDEPMSKHSTFKVGGNCDVMFMPKNIDEIVNGIKFINLHKINFFVLGKGSNILVSDNGYKGVIIKLSMLKNTSVYEDKIEAEAGVSLANLSRVALENSLSNIEFASGIPGTVGGAVFMNAGAYGGEIKDIIIEAKIMDQNGNIEIFNNKQLELGYRSSIIEKKGLIVLSATFKLEKADKDKIKEKMDTLLKQRNEKQPVEKPSAGSTFKRPDGHFAGKLIMDSNLKGYKIGGAKVSEKHCGFIINDGNATAKDVVDLIEYVKKVVFEKFGVMLEKEVKFLGFDCE